MEPLTGLEPVTYGLRSRAPSAGSSGESGRDPAAGDTLGDTLAQLLARVVLGAVSEGDAARALEAAASVAVVVDLAAQIQAAALRGDWPAVVTVCRARASTRAHQPPSGSGSAQG